MYAKLKITELKLQILSLFTNDFNRDYYIREIQKILKISPRTSQLILEDLENKGVLISKYRGKIKTFKLNMTESTKRYLIFVEQYKLISFLENKLIVKEVIEQITPYIKGIGIIFGSFVKNLEQKNSDLDIFIAGSYDENEIKKISKKFDLELSIKCYPIKHFDQNLKKDIFLTEILKNHIVFLNTEKFIEAIFNEK